MINNIDTSLTGIAPASSNGGQTDSISPFFLIAMFQAAHCGRVDKEARDDILQRADGKFQEDIMQLIAQAGNDPNNILQMINSLIKSLSRANELSSSQLAVINQLKLMSADMKGLVEKYNEAKKTIEEDKKVIDKYKKQMSKAEQDGSANNYLYNGGYSYAYAKKDFEDKISAATVQYNIDYNTKFQPVQSEIQTFLTATIKNIQARGKDQYLKADQAIKGYLDDLENTMASAIPDNNN